MKIYTRSHGEFAATMNAWPREEEKETKAAAEVYKRKSHPNRRQGNRWDQYGESSSSATSSEALLKQVQVLVVFAAFAKVMEIP